MSRPSETRNHDLMTTPTVDVYKQTYQVGTLVRKNVFAILTILGQLIDYSTSHVGRPDL
jgi:hypothetical protein